MDKNNNLYNIIAKIIKNSNYLYSKLKVIFFGVNQSNVISLNKNIKF